MKGQMEETGWMIIVGIAAIAIAIIAFALFAQYQAKNILNPSSPASVDFAYTINKPYTIATALANYLADNRQVLEHAIEASATGSLKNSNSGHLPSLVRQFLLAYKNNAKFISVTVYKENKEILYTDISAVGEKCGDNFEGYCATKNVIFGPLSRPRLILSENSELISVKCGKGRKSIDDQITNPNNECGFMEECCVEDTVIFNNRPQWTIQNWPLCGDYVNGVQAGICDYDIGPGGPDGECLPGRIGIPDIQKVCEKQDPDMSSRIGKPLYTCCTPISSKIQIRGSTSSAQVPLIYKDSVATLQVTTG